MRKNHRCSGAATIVGLLFLTINAIIAQHCIKKSNEERYAFYGKKISFAEEKFLLNKTAFYFDYNSYKIYEKDRLALFAHSRKLLQNPKLNVLISGHTDNAGPVWYNFKLSNQRAIEVAKIFNFKGVTSNRMTVIGYANQVPLINYYNTYDKNFEKLNRRVEIVYQYKYKP